MLTALMTAFAFGALAQGAEPRVRALPTPEDPAQKTVLLGRNVTDSMIVTLELEPVKSLWLQTGNPPKWREHTVRKGEIYHLDVKPVDPDSKVVISYAEVGYKGVNRTNGKKVSGTLHPIWDSSGLHYAANSPLAGEGNYEITISVGMPTFGRVRQYKDMWLKPVTSKFHFKLVNGKVMDASEIAVN